MMVHIILEKWGLRCIRDAQDNPYKVPLDKDDPGEHE